ncbi:MAG: neutral/alkaline non-lysosomal ceramidase N-terminal domain-containing protein [Desulfosudaceae bacterium]
MQRMKRYLIIIGGLAGAAIVLWFWLGNMPTTVIRIDHCAPLAAGGPEVPATGSAGKSSRPVPAVPLMAGVAKVDITPPPGISMAGYSVMAGTGQGFRGRLHARAIYLRSANLPGVVLLQCDLLSGSRLLHHRVAELIAATTDVPVNGLMLAGTHTHSAPGNCFGSNFYNSFAAAEKGLDEDLYHFLAARMAAAVDAAFQVRRPARIAAGSMPLYGMTRNRSLAAWQANPGTDPAADPLAAVNPEFFMMRIDLQDEDGQFRPAGAFSSFSIHPTVVSDDNPFYTADVFGYIAGELETVYNHGGDLPWTFVHAAVNGTHGDNSPNYEPGRQGFMETERLGRAIGQQAVNLFASLRGDMAAKVSVTAACREVDLYREPSLGKVSVCERPVVGNALLAGAEDGQTPVLHRLPFFKEGWWTTRWFFTDSCQGRKRHAGWFLQPLFLPKPDFPHRLFFQVIRVNDFALVPLPFEVTCQAGESIAKAVEAVEGVSRGLVISCANGYFGYAATAAEYGQQHYEGGHTLYGPATTAFLAAHAADLAADPPAEGKNGLPDSWVFSVKKKNHFPPDRTPGDRRAQITPPYFMKAADNRQASWRFQWRDVAPSRIDFHRPLVYMEISADGERWHPLVQAGRTINDRGYAMSVRFCDNLEEHQMGLYEAVWYDPEIPPDHQCRFVVRPRDEQKVLYSSCFAGDRTRARRE